MTTLTFFPARASIMTSLSMLNLSFLRIISDMRVRGTPISLASSCCFFFFPFNVFSSSIIRLDLICNAAASSGGNPRASKTFSQQCFSFSIFSSLSHNGFQTGFCQVNILFLGLLRFLLKSVQNVNHVADFCHVKHPKFATRVYPNLTHASANRSH